MVPLEMRPPPVRGGNATTFSWEKNFLTRHAASDKIGDETFNKIFDYTNDEGYGT